MKFNINIKDLADALKPSLNLAVKTSDKEFEFADKITITAKQDNISVCAYSKLASIVSNLSNKIFPLDYECIEEGEVTVYVDDLVGTLTTMPQEKGEIKSKKGQVIVSLLSDEDYSREMSVFEKSVKVPKIATKFIKEINVNREVFVKGMNSVSFSIAYEEKLWYYMCVLFEAFDDKVRFSAGTGGQWAVKSIEGSRVVQTKEPCKIIFPNKNKNFLSNIMKTLADCTDEIICIKYAEADKKKNIPEQIIITFEKDAYTLCIFGVEEYTKSHDLDTILQYSYPNKIYSELESWGYAIGGVGVSRHRYTDSIHNTEVKLLSNKEKFIVTSQTKNKQKSPVPLADAKKCTIKGKEIWFKCNTEFLENMIRCGAKTGKIRMNFESQEILANEPDDSKKKLKPVLVEYADTPNASSGFNEKFCLFFGISTK